MPFDCSDCEVGAHAIYAPAHQRCPSAVCQRRTRVVSFKPHQTIYRAGAKVEHIYTIYSGWAVCAITLPDGRRQILSFLVPGDPLPIEALMAVNSPLPFGVRALTELQVCEFNAQDMCDLVSSEEIQFKYFRSEVFRLINRMHRRLADVGQRRAIGRIAQLVLELEERLRERALVENDSFEFPLRQDDIGAALGLTPAHVNRTLVALRRRHILEIGQGRLSILDRPALMQIAYEE